MVVGFHGNQLQWLRKNVQSPLESSPSTTQRESQSNGVSDFLTLCNGLLCQGSQLCPSDLCVGQIDRLTATKFHISLFFLKFILWQSMPTPALCVPKAGDCWCFPVTQLSNCRNSIQVFLMCTSQGHRCGVFISCHCVTLNCSLRSNNINFFGPLCWGKCPLSLPTQPEPSNLRPPPLHTPMEIKGWVGDSWPLLRTDCCTRVQLKGKCFCAFQDRLPGTDRTETFRYKKRFKTTFKGRINHVNESLRGSKVQLPLFDLPVFTLSTLVSKCLLESGDRSYWSV